MYPLVTDTGTNLFRTDVGYKHPLYTRYENYYQTIRDAMEGSVIIKEAGTRYLPTPNAEAQDSPAQDSRYKIYRQRAVFPSTVKDTVDDFVNQAFVREPLIELPPSLEPLLEDATGFGLGLGQLAKRLVRLVLAFGRAGLYADYPAAEEETRSVGDLKRQNFRPLLKPVEPWNILNWFVINNSTVFVIIAEKLAKRKGYEFEWIDLYRTLNNGSFGYDSLGDQNSAYDDLNFRSINGYYVDIFTCEGDAAGMSTTYRCLAHYVPRTMTGDTMADIPFWIIGSENNDWEVDDPPMWGITDQCIAQYRNSADYEESVHVTGQQSLFLTVPERHIEDLLKRKIVMGARSAQILPEGTTVSLMGSIANSQPFEAITHKDKKMASMGAKMLEQQNVQRTATEAAIELLRRNSVVKTVTDNVNVAVLSALQRVAEMMGENPESVKFKIDTGFEGRSMPYQDRAQLLAEYEADVITKSEVRNQLRQIGVATLEDEEAEAEMLEADLKEAPPEPEAPPQMPPQDMQDEEVDELVS